VLFIWIIIRQIASHLWKTGVVNIKTKLTSNNNKANSQVTALKKTIAIDQIANTLNMNSRGAPDIRPKLIVTFTLELNFSGGLAHGF
jgi:hypothetical protein